MSFVAEHSQYSSIVMFFENYSKLRLILCHAFKMPSKASQLPLVRRDPSPHDPSAHNPSAHDPAHRASQHLLIQLGHRARRPSRRVQ